MALRAGARADITDLALPAEVVQVGSGTNTVTAVAFANLPTTGAAASIINPHPSAKMRVRVSFSAICSTSDATGLWVCPAVTGSTAISAGAGGGGAAGLSEMIYTKASAAAAHHASFVVTLPVSANAAVFTLQAYREAATGTQQVDQPVVRLTPIGYDFTA
jgi:hypothetical protein